MQQEIKKTKEIVQKFADFYYSLDAEKQSRVDDFIEGVNFTLSLKKEKADGINSGAKG